MTDGEGRPDTDGADEPENGPDRPDRSDAAGRDLPDDEAAGGTVDQPTAGGTGSGAASPLVFLAGAVLFLGGVVAFVADLVTGHDVARSLAVNAVGALVLVGWAAVDTLSDPESAVASRGGAAGTALLLFGAYLVAAGVVVGVTSVRHGRPRLALLAGGGGVVAVVVGFLVFPTTAVVDGSEPREDSAGGDRDVP